MQFQFVDWRGGGGGGGQMPILHSHLEESIYHKRTCNKRPELEVKILKFAKYLKENDEQINDSGRPDRKKEKQQQQTPYKIVNSQPIVCLHKVITVAYQGIIFKEAE